MSINSDTPRRGLDLAFGTSFLTTMAVAVAPSFVSFGFLVWSRSDPRPLLATLVALVATAAAFVLGSKVWEKQPESHGFSFADLMLWHWVRREWAEEKLVRNARLLGYDRQGRFVGKVEISPERQMFAAREIGAALDAKSSYTLNHSKRVEKHVRDVAIALDLSPEEVEQLATAAALHDIGNIRIPEQITRKIGELTLEERSTIEGHVLLGAIMAFEAGGDLVVQGLRHHHEWWDGKGYPSGFKGEEIPLFARIIGIAEAYDAMTSTRPYRQSLTQDQAVRVLRKEGGTQFDPRLVETFASTLPEPLQIVERFPVLAWAQRQVRELTILFRRVGGTAVSAAASTLAIALILGTAMLKPDVFPGGRDGTDTTRPERGMIAQGNAQTEDTSERIALAAADGPSVGEGVVVAEEFALSGTNFIDGVQVLGERITIEGVEPGGSAGHGGDGGVGGNHGGGGGGPDHGDTDGGDSNPDIVGSGGGDETQTPPGGGTTNPDPSIDESKPGKGIGRDKDKGKPDNRGNGHGKGKPDKDKGKPDKGKGKPDSWVNSGKGGENKPDKTRTSPSDDKSKTGDKGNNGNGPDKTDDGWAESESNGKPDDKTNNGNGNDKSESPDVGSDDGGAPSSGGSSEASEPGNSSDAPGHSEDKTNGSDKEKDTGPDKSSSSSSTSDSSSSSNSGDGSSADKDKGKDKG